MPYGGDCQSRTRSSASREAAVPTTPAAQPDSPLPPPDPIVLLGLPASHNSLVGAVLGQHPALYDLPETHLFGFDTLADWRQACDGAGFQMADGLLRAVACLFFGRQDDESIFRAAGWLRRRRHVATGFVLEMLAGSVLPRIVIEKSPSLLSDPRTLPRLREMFPLARYVHLVENPIAFGERLLGAVKASSEHGPTPTWLLQLASFPCRFAHEDATPIASVSEPPDLDPQRAWYALNANAEWFLRSVPHESKYRVRVEALLANPRRELAAACRQFGIDAEPDTIEQMLHPERSDFSRPGPPAAVFGNDPAFLESPTFPDPFDDVLSRRTLTDPLPWRTDQRAVWPEVAELARSFGYT